MAAYTSGLRNAMQAWNDADIEMMNIQFGMLDRMIEAKKASRELQGSVGQSKKEFYEGEIEEQKYFEMLKTNEGRRTAASYLTNTLGVDPSSVRFFIDNPSAFSQLISGKKSEDQLKSEYGWQDTSGQSLQKPQTGQPITEQPAPQQPIGMPTQQPATVPFYDLQTRESASKSQANILENEALKRQRTYESGEGLPELTGQKNVVTTEEAIKQAPLKTRTETAEASIKETEEAFEWKRTVKELAKLDAEAEFLGKKDLYEPMDQYMQLQDKERMILKLLNDMEDSRAKGTENEWMAMWNNMLSNTFPSAGMTKDNMDLAEIYLRQQLQDIGRMKGSVQQKSPDQFKPTKYITYPLPDKGLSPHDEDNIRALEAKGYTVIVKKLERKTQSATPAKPGTQQAQPKPKVKSQAGKGAEQTKPKSQKPIINKKSISKKEWEEL